MTGERRWRNGRTGLRSLCCYAAVGLGVFAVDYTLFVALTAGAGLAPLLANPISRSVGAATCFLGHREITFRPWRSGDRWGTHAVRFVLVFGAALALSQGFLWLFHHVVALPAAVAKPLAEGLVFGCNFVLLGRWAFV